ncbi:MAG: hypothetical protein LKJ76_10365 [Lachnospiraceae bacterium]|nr:hypothetical protein [Lachnospiraceae bacterium]
MKNRWLARLFLTLCLLLITTACFRNGISAVHAEQTWTVSGTVGSKTSDVFLYFETSAGEMIIKIDTSTDTTDCKILIPGKAITVTCYRGNDAYLHASRISSSEVQTNVVVDKQNVTSVYGRVESGTTDSLLYFNTSGGEMQIKLDKDTDMSACTILTVDKWITVTVGRGSDAYMHAVKITDGNVASGSSYATVTPTSANVTVSGTVYSGTSTSLLCLATSGGVMQIRLDANTNLSNCKMLFPDQYVTAVVYRGSDAYMHAASITNNTVISNWGATLEGSTSTVTGTLTAGTTSQVLYLSTSGGIMQIRYDGTTNLSSGMLVLGKNVKVVCSRGNDAFMHAVAVYGN